MNAVISDEDLLPYVLGTMTEAVVVVNLDLKIRYVNDTAMRLIQGFTKSQESPIGMDFYNYVGFTTHAEGKTTLEEVLKVKKPRYGVIRKLPNGTVHRMNITPLIVDDIQWGILITSQDVTEMFEMEEELDHAFSLTLPNSKVEYKLKHTVEYQDEYDPDTRKITVTGIVQDGVYRHVVNSLKIFASLAVQGITKVIGINKDDLVQAIIFHDLGKTQPRLKIGDVVDPKEVFEESKLHAFRGAELALHYYSKADDIVEIIRYHHHGEQELPETFPWRLLPMLRLFQLIDGLSAAITRGGVEVDFGVEDTTVVVTERNRRPQYNGTWRINLYTGERTKLDWVDVVWERCTGFTFDKSGWRAL